MTFFFIIYIFILIKYLYNCSIVSEDELEEELKDAGDETLFI